MGVFDAPPVALGLDEAKLLLRLESGSDDAVLAGVLGAVTRACEDYTGLALVERECVETLPITGRWQRLARAPVAAITGVEGVPAEGSVFPLTVGAYAIDIDARGEGWVRVSMPGAAGRVRVTYRAGLAAGSDAVPQALRHGMGAAARQMMRLRDGEADEALPASARALWRPWRRMRVA